MTSGEPSSDDGFASLELLENWSPMKDGWASDEMKEFLSDLHITYTMAPGEAHTRLGAVERRHQLLRKSVEIYLHDRRLNSKDGIKTALSHNHSRSTHRARWLWDTSLDLLVIFSLRT